MTHSTAVPATSEMANSVIGPKPRRAYLVTLTAVPQNSDAVTSAASGSLVIIVGNYVSGQQVLSDRPGVTDLHSRHPKSG